VKGKGFLAKSQRRKSEGKRFSREGAKDFSQRRKDAKEKRKGFLAKSQRRKSEGKGQRKEEKSLL